MKPGTEHTPTDKPSIPAVNPTVVMDEKTYQQYKQDLRKILVRSFMTGAVVWFALVLQGYVSWNIFVIFSFDIIFLALFAGSLIYIFSKAKLYTKYKIPTVGYRNNSSGSNLFNNDDNPYHSGSKAWYIYGSGSRSHFN